MRIVGVRRVVGIEGAWEVGGGSGGGGVAEVVVGDSVDGRDDELD